MANKRKSMNVPSAPIILVMVGGLLILASGILAVIGIAIGVTFIDGHLMIVPLQGISIYHGILETLVGIVLVFSVFYIISRKKANLQNWLAAALILAVVSVIGGGGFFIGFVLVLMGGILGIFYVYSVSNRQIYVRHAAIATERKPAAAMKTPTGVIKALSQEEKRLYSLIEGEEGAIFQAELVEKSGYSKVKVSRILDKLEGKGLIERKRRGMTNMVIIKKP